MRQKREKSSKKQVKPRAPRSKTKLAELEVQNKATSIPLPADYDSSLVPPDEYIVLKDIWARI